MLTDRAGADLCRSEGVDLPVLLAESPRAVLGTASAEVYGHPARSLRLVGVTGTQGKTTTTRLAEAALTAAGERAAVVGTVGTRIAGHDVASSLTTPEAPALHALFAVMVEEQVSGCVMEVSSHALVMGRVDGVVFDVAAFTNLGRDHLDFHRDLEDYFAAKAQLFTPARARTALVNVDDEHGRRLLAEAAIPTRGFSRSAGAGADWWVEDVVPSTTGSRVTARGPVGELGFEVPLPGDFNVANALCAVAMLAEAGYDPHRVAQAMGRAGGVPGRMEAVDEGQGFTAVVDYAHKPDAVEAVLGSVRPATTGRVIVVLGAGGDRDRGKREVMGEIAARRADVVVVTDDNPRSEDPAADPGRAAGRCAPRRRRAARGGRPRGRDRARRGARASWRLRRGGRQGPRDRAGGRRRGPPLRRPRGAAVRAASRRGGCVVIAWTLDEIAETTGGVVADDVPGAGAVVVSGPRVHRLP